MPPNPGKAFGENRFRSDDPVSRLLNDIRASEAGRGARPEASPETGFPVVGKQINTGSGQAKITADPDPGKGKARDMGIGTLLIIGIIVWVILRGL